MFPSFVSNLIWGSSSNDGTDDSIQQQHEEDLTVSEEQGDWLVIDYTSTGKRETEIVYTVYTLLCLITTLL